MPRTSQSRSAHEGRRSRRATPRRGPPRVAHPPRSTSESRRAISEASGVPARCPPARRLAHLAEDLVGHRGPAGHALEGGGLERSDPAEVVLRRRELARGGAHRGACVGALGEEPERRCEVGDLVRADAHLQRDSFGQLREPPHVRHDQRLPERERADRGPARLAHRRRAKADVDVARRHERPQPALVDEPLADDPVSLQPEPLEPPVEVEPGRGGADEQEPGARVLRPYPGERLEQLRHALGVVDVPERADRAVPRAGRPARRPARARRGAGRERSRR